MTKMGKKLRASRNEKTFPFKSLIFGLLGRRRKSLFAVKTREKAVSFGADFLCGSYSITAVQKNTVNVCFRNLNYAKLFGWPKKFNSIHHEFYIKCEMYFRLKNHWNSVCASERFTSHIHLSCIDRNLKFSWLTYVAIENCSNIYSTNSFKMINHWTVIAKLSFN